MCGNIYDSIVQGLIFGFTFAIGWVAALLVLGAVIA